MKIKMKKKILSATFVAVAILLLNVMTLFSEDSMEHLILLQNVESLAGGEEVSSCESLSFEGRELKSYVCSDGSYYSVCESSSSYNSCCNPDDETPCGVGTSPDDTALNSPGSTAIIEKECSQKGHQYVITRCYKTCSRCGISYNLCLD